MKRQQRLQFLQSLLSFRIQCFKLSNLLAALFVYSNLSKNVYDLYNL